METPRICGILSPGCGILPQIRKTLNCRLPWNTPLNRCCRVLQGIFAVRLPTSANGGKLLVGEFR
jgi:hypothetical protein